jgi:hypothetical protein
MPQEKESYDDKNYEDPMLGFHITPPFTSPRGPVQCRLANIQPSSAIMPSTVNVIATAKTRG